MKKSIFIYCFVLFATVLSAQNKFHPTIMILIPDKTSVEKSLEKELNQLNQQIDKSRNETENEDFLEGEENLKKIFEYQASFRKSYGVYDALSLITSEFLMYRFYERFESALIFPLYFKSTTDVSVLKELADKYDVEFIITIPELAFVKNGDEKTGEANAHVYMRTENKIIYHGSFTGNDRNQGFEFSCKDGSLGCCINNLVASMSGDIIKTVVENDPEIVQLRNLQNNRIEKLMTNYLIQVPDTTITKIISENLKEIDVSDCFHTLVNETGDKFYAHFVISSDKKSFKDLKGSGDKQINIVTDDINNIDQVPSYYSFEIAGIKYNNQWYLDKVNNTYYNAKDMEMARKIRFSYLANDDFFGINTMNENPDFWYKGHFKIIESAVEKNKKEIEELKVKMEKEKDEKKASIYQRMIDDYYEKDAKNEGKFGMYELVVRKLNEKTYLQNKMFNDSLSQSLIPDFLNQYIKNEKELLSFSKHNAESFIMIYPQDRKVVLMPVKFNTEKSAEVHFFVLLHNGKSYDLYEWSYFKPFHPEYDNIGPTLVDKMSELTRWNFSFRFLDDKEFWEKYVLKQENGKYKYLESVK